MYQLRVNEMIDSCDETDYLLRPLSDENKVNNLKNFYASRNEENVEYRIEFYRKLQIFKNRVDENECVDFDDDSDFEIGEIFKPKEDIEDIFTMLRKGFVYIEKIDLTTKKSNKYHPKRSIKKLLKEQGRGWRRVYCLEDRQDRQLLKELSLICMIK